MVDQSQSQPQPPIQMVTIDERIIDMDELTHAIVAAEGDLAVVAERLLGHMGQQKRLLEAISNNPEAINAFSAKARVLATIKLLSLVSAFHINALEGVHELSAKEAANLFLKTTEALEKYTAPVPTAVASGTADQQLARLMPREVLHALKSFQLNTVPLSVIDAESDRIDAVGANISNSQNEAEGE